MKEIKVKFVDFWKSYVPEEDLFFECLSKKYKIILSDKPDYLFFSTFGEEHLKYNDCVKIFYTGENLCPDFNVCDYAIGFEHMEFGDRYFRLPVYYISKYSNDLNYCTNKKEFTKQDLEKKEGFCSFVYSNSNADPIREEVFDKLNNYKKVYSGGKFKNNVGGPVADKIEFQKKYKFCISFENSSHDGYTTEKIIQAYASDSIPIYWGDKKINKIFNKKSFINMNDFSSIEEALSYIQKIDNDDNMYLNIINQPVFINENNSREKVMQKLEQFLYNIIDQDLKDAYRMNRIFWGEKYLNKLIDYNKAYNRSILVKIKKIKSKMFK